MNLTFRLLTLASFIVFTFNADPAYAQIKFGPKAGLNFSELPNRTKYIINQQIYSGYHLGAMAEFKLSDHLFIQPGILISNKGSKYIVGNNAGGINTGFSNFQFSGFFAEVPLNLAYKFYTRSFNLFLTGGPQFGYGLTGKWTATYGTSSNIHFGIDPTDDLKPFDYGFCLGGGFEKGSLQISAQYYNGFKTLSTVTPPLNEQKFKVLAISVGYLFGKDKRSNMDYEKKYLRKSGNKRGHYRKYQ